ncbi:MAG: DUF192 domain-containing protein [Sphingomicrobium sp.]
MALAAACTPPSPASEPLPEAGANHGLREIPLIVRSRDRDHSFTVEVAASLPEQQTGMMFRRSLSPDRGMLFPYSPPQPVGFWMKDTYIPLDMIFIRANGTIARVATAMPHSLDNTSSGEPIVAVLEISGGRAAELGIAEGDRVDYRL